MSEPASLAEIASRLKALEAQAEPVRSVGPVRFVVATDWTSAATPLTLLRAYLAAFSEGAPVELCFVTPHEPSPADVECIQILLEGVPGAPGMAGVALASFEEVADTAYDSAVVPSGDPDLLVAEVGGLVTRMFDVARQLMLNDESPGEFAAGSNDALRARLRRFAA